MLGMLEDEGERTSIEAEIGPAQYKRFEIIRSNINNGFFGRLYGTGQATPNISSPIAESTLPEVEFHKKLMTRSGSRLLFERLNVGPKATMIHEYEMTPYGRCDFVVRDGRHVCAVEVKIGEAKSAVGSQIDKYRLALELDMSLGMWDTVSAAVVAEGFSPYVAGELSRLDVRMITHNGSPESLKVESS
jgi:hypothetical protein